MLPTRRGAALGQGTLTLLVRTLALRLTLPLHCASFGLWLLPLLSPAATFRSRCLLRLGIAFALLGPTSLGWRLLPLIYSTATFGSRCLLRLGIAFALLGPTSLGWRLLPLIYSTATFGSRCLLRLGIAFAVLGPTTLGRRRLPLLGSAAALGLRRLSLLLLALLRLLLARAPGLRLLGSLCAQLRAGNNKIGRGAELARSATATSVPRALFQIVDYAGTFLG